MTNTLNHLRKIALIACYCVIFCGLGLLFTVPAQAQFIGFVGLQTVTANFTVNCTGSAQTFVVPNIGQNSHYVFYSNTAVLATSVQVYLAGSNGGLASTSISSIATQVFRGSIQASGYYSVVAILMSCTSGSTYSLAYTGSNAPPSPPGGTTLYSQNEQVLGYGLTAGANNTTSLQTPYGSSSGGIWFSYQGGAGPSNSTIQVTCFSVLNNASANADIQFSFTLATTNNSTQYFPIPPQPCPQAQVVYNSGGASSSTINLLYEFNPPGVVSTATIYTHITGTTATAVKATGGLLHTLSVNLGGAGTISVFDLASASCTGTPATNLVAIITATATTLQTFTYDVNLQNGICVKASVAMDITVSAQ